MDARMPEVPDVGPGPAGRLRILLVGHACAPDLGSEPGFTWNWAWHLSERHDVWVIAHPAHRPAVEAALARAPERHVHMAWLGRPRWWALGRPERDIGRAAGRARACQYVTISIAAV